MPAWSFQARFRAALLNGLAEAEGRPPPYPELAPKRQTIRACWRNGRDPRPGQRCRLWLVMRTPERELLGETPPISRLPIRIPHAGAAILGPQRIPRASVTRLARRDGFESAGELFTFLEAYHGFPFVGFVFRW